VTWHSADHERSAHAREYFRCQETKEYLNIIRLLSRVTLAFSRNTLSYFDNRQTVPTLPTMLMSPTSVHLMPLSGHNCPSSPEFHDPLPTMEISTAFPRQLLIATLLACVTLLLPGTAAAATDAGSKGQVKVTAKLEKTVVKVSEKVTLTGRLDVAGGTRRAASAPAGLEPIVVQKLQAGVWVDVTTGSCRPNGGFTLHLSFDVAVDLSLRVYHPESDAYLAAHSEVVSVSVI
jgi:hypothetical protein